MPNTQANTAPAPEPEPVTPLTVIRDASAPGTHGKVGEATARGILAALAAAGFTIVKGNSL